MNSEEVLIIGGGYAGLTTAVLLAVSGIRSTVIDKNERFGGKLAEFDRIYKTEVEPRKVVSDLLEKCKDSGIVELLGNTKLTKVSGAAGDFKCAFSTGDEKWLQSFGAIVLATGSSLKLQDGLLGIQDLEEAARDAKHVGIILSSGGKSSIVQTQAALDRACSLHGKGVEMTVLYQQMRVAGPGLQPLYDKARADGVVFIRYAGKPSISKSDGDFEVEFVAEEVGERVRMRCGVLACEGEEVPSAGAKDLAEMLRINIDGAGFFQKENIYMYQVGTCRRGMFAAGSCRKPSTLEEAVSDAYSCAAQIKEMFAELRDGPPVKAPSVDSDACAFCLTCYRACPHRAIGFDFEKRAVRIFENACYACGVCIGECPARAIKLENGKPKPERAKIVAFFCQHSASETYKKLKAKETNLPDIAVREVNCSGTVEVPDILEAFEQGADGVVIGGCHKGSCRSLTGSHYAEKRSMRIKEVIESVGLEPGRLEMLFVSDVETNELANALRDFGRRLEGRSNGEEES